MLFYEVSIFFNYLFSEVICIFVFSDMLRYTILKTCDTFTLDNVYRSPSCVEFILLTIFYGKDNMHDSFITLDRKSLSKLAQTIKFIFEFTS